jgi:hypothetical protein
MDYQARAARFRECAKEIRSSTAAMTGAQTRNELMRLVDYYEQMATTYEELAKVKTRK